MTNMNLRIQRILKNLKSQECARKVGITKEFYSSIENGRVLPSHKTQNRIAKVLGVSRKMFWSG